MILRLSVISIAVISCACFWNWNRAEKPHHTPTISVVENTSANRLASFSPGYKTPLIPIIENPIPLNSKIETQPNIIVINLDDADRDAVEIDFRRPGNYPYLPNIKRLANEGFRFSNCHCAVPICNPSRVCMFTGQYAYKTGVRNNIPSDIKSRGTDGGFLPFRFQGPFGSTAQPYFNNEIGCWMRQAGYHTMMVGKYLHDQFEPMPGGSWNDVMPPGWEDFYPSFGSSYFTTMMMKGTQFSFVNNLDPTTYPIPYRTAVENVDILNLINSNVKEDSNRPFFLYYAPLACHREDVREICIEENQPKLGMVDPRFKQWWPDLKQVRDGDFNETDVSDKPNAIQSLPLLSDIGTTVGENDYLQTDLEYRRRVLCLKSVDILLGKVMELLNQKGIAQNTIIILTSDHGYQLGQQRHVGKSLPYDRVTNVSFMVWGPGYFSGGPDYLSHLISHVDLAPTLLEIAGAPIPSEIQGKSFLPILDGRYKNAASEWRPGGVLVEHWGLSNDNGTPFDSTYCSIRQYDSVYTEWANGDKEYYKLTNDPFQLKNKYTQLDEGFKSVLANRLGILKNSMATPVSFLEAPFTNNDVFYQSVRLAGLAEFKNEIKEVRLKITDINDAETLFWNGTGWVKDQTAFVLAELDSNENLIANWHYKFAPPANNFRKYRVAVKAVGHNGEVQSKNLYKDFYIDVDQPVSQLSAPIVGTTTRYYETVKLTGWARDDFGIRSVRVAIRNFDSQKYWNGKTWQDDYILLPTKIVRNQIVRVEWEYDFKPPEAAGSAIVTIRATSTDGRYDRPAPTSRISWAAIH